MEEAKKKEKMQVNTCECKDGKECTCEDSCTCDTCDCEEQCTCEHDCECDSQNSIKEECNCNSCEVEEPQKEEEQLEEKKKGIFKKDKNKEKIKELEKMVQNLEDNNLRTKAEFVNFRRRKEEETSRMLKYANEDLIKELLPTIDNFERAIDMDDDNLEDEVSKFLSGFKMIYCNLTNVLKKYEVVEIEALNQPFDPTIHQAVMTEKKEGVEAGIVIDVLQKGYKLKDKVIRPSMVKVSE